MADCNQLPILVSQNPRNQAFEAKKLSDLGRLANIKVIRDLIRNIETAIKGWPSAQSQQWMAYVTPTVVENSCIACPRKREKTTCRITDLAIIFLKRTCFGCAQIFIAIHTILSDADSDYSYYYFSKFDTWLKDDSKVQIQSRYRDSTDNNYELIRIDPGTVTRSDCKFSSDTIAKHMVVEAFPKRKGISFPVKRRFA
jgi:hypothetical protein